MCPVSKLRLKNINAFKTNDIVLILCPQTTGDFSVYINLQNSHFWSVLLTDKRLGETAAATSDPLVKKAGMKGEGMKGG